MADKPKPLSVEGTCTPWPGTGWAMSPPFAIGTLARWLRLQPRMTCYNAPVSEPPFTDKNPVQ